MGQTYAVRRCKESDIPGISILANQVLHANRNNDYWEWKYFRNPVGQILSTIVLSDGRIVGLLGDIPLRFSVGGIEAIGVQEVDVAIFEDHRRLDVYLKMVSSERGMLLAGNVDFAYGITNADTSILNQILFGKKNIAPVPRLVKVLDIKRFLRKRFSNNALLKILPPIANTVIRLRYRERMVIPKGMRIKQIDRFDERFDTFWNRIKWDYPIMMVRDSSYLNWRYVDIPVMSYEIFCLERIGSNEICGFIVLSEREQDYLIGEIYDIVTPRSEDPIITRCLIGFAIRHFDQKKAALIRCWMFSHCHVFPELSRIGFITREKKGIDLHFEPINLQNSAIPADLIEKRGNWYLSKGDADRD